MEKKQAIALIETVTNLFVDKGYTLDECIRLVNIEEKDLEAYVKAAIYHNMQSWDNAFEQLKILLAEHNTSVPQLTLMTLSNLEPDFSNESDYFLLLLTILNEQGKLEEQLEQLFVVCTNNWLVQRLRSGGGDVFSPQEKQFINKCWELDIHINVDICCRMWTSIGDYNRIYETVLKTPQILEWELIQHSFMRAVKTLNKERECLEKLSESNLPLITPPIRKTVSVINESLSFDYEKKNLNIVYCFNRTYVPAFLASMNSLIKNNSESLPFYSFHLFLDSTLTEEDMSSIVDFCEYYNLTFSITNIESYIKSDDFKTMYGVNDVFQLDKSAYYRIFAVEYLMQSGSTDDTIYLDCDTLIFNDIHRISNIKSKNLLLAVKEETENNSLVRMSMRQNNLESYFNSGVMFFKTSNRKLYNDLRNAIKLCTEHDQSKIFLQDQCVLNIAFNEKWTNIPKTFNLQTHRYFDNTDFDNLSILHFVGRMKPWDTCYTGNKVLSKIWQQYLPANEKEDYVRENDDITINTRLCAGVKGHRSGWGYVVKHLNTIHSSEGILFDDYIERTHGWSLYGNTLLNKIPHKEDWVGVTHNPPNAPEWFGSDQNPKVIFNNMLFKESLKKCKGLITMSEYHKRYLQNKIDIPIKAIKHPSELCDIKFDFQSFKESRKVIQLGYWLRKMKAIYDIKSKCNKYWLMGQKYAENMFTKEKYITGHKHDINDVNIVLGLSNQKYDEFLSNSIIFLDLYDSSANNAIIESLCRDIPILINKLEPVVEYLGPDYPFYYNNQDELESKINDLELIYETYNYIKSMNKDFLQGENFIKSMKEAITEFTNE